MSDLFTRAEQSEHRMYRIELPHDDGSREFVAFVRQRWVPAWEAIGCIATELPARAVLDTHGGAK